MTADAIGGVWTYVNELARACRNRQVHFTVALMGPPPSSREAARLQASGNVTLEHRPYKLEWMPNPWDDVDAAGEWLLDLAERTDPDCIQINGYAHAALDFGKPAIIVAHSCACSWWRAVRGAPAPSSWDVYRGRVRDGLGGAAIVVAPTRAMLSALRREYGFRGRRMVIPNGIGSFPGSADHKEPFVFAAGRLWDEAKNLAALNRIAEELPWPVAVAGSGSRHDEHEASLNGGHAGNGRHARNGRNGHNGHSGRNGHDPDHGQSPGTIQLGRLDVTGVREWMRRASIYAFPARYEPFGLSILEAAHTGCALVLGDIPTLREIWTDAAVFVPPNDPDTLGRAIRRLIDEPDRRRALSASARERAGAFTLETLGSAYRGLYDELTTRSLAVQTAARREARPSRGPREVPSCG